MSCSNCYNGCAETISDKCVKYTGSDVDSLEIKNGDSLLDVEQALTKYLISALDGTGIKLTIDSSIICDIVNKHLSCCTEFTLPNIISALIKATCELDERLTNLEEDFAALEGSYTIGCLTGVTASSGTHAILQAVIAKLCTVETTLSALSLNVNTNYVKLSELNSLIADYLSSQEVSTKLYNKMVPYTVVEYYGSLTGKFDASGAGLGDWERIYLCNGNNGTPDKRGRVGVGATTGMGGGTMNSAVDPSVSGNPSYALLGTAGSNNIVLTSAQMPAHTHVATATVNDPGHVHTFDGSIQPGGGGEGSRDGVQQVLSTNSATTGISVSVTNASTGDGLAHPNYQPGLGCYYIMYIPSS